MLRPKIMKQFSCHTHFKILLEVPHPNSNIFSSSLDDLEIDLGDKGRTRLLSHPVAPPLVGAN